MNISFPEKIMKEANRYRALLPAGQPSPAFGKPTHQSPCAATPLIPSEYWQARGFQGTTPQRYRDWDRDWAKWDHAPVDSAKPRPVTPSTKAILPPMVCTEAPRRQRLPLPVEKITEPYRSYKTQSTPGGGLVAEPAAHTLLELTSVFAYSPDISSHQLGQQGLCHECF